jgi:large subunit ribosomal protein L3
MRTGLILEKMGSSSLFTEKGERVEVTLLQMSECQVVANRTIEKNGYNAVLLGYGSLKASKVAKPNKKLFADAKIEPKRHLKEFRVTDSNLLEVGNDLNVDHFTAGQFVDVTADSKGKGFAGVMKRHNFRGLEATHGVSITHRSHGSTGGRQDPGRVFKNKKMAGHLGDERVTVQNLQIMEVRPDQRVLVIKGSVPGAKGSYIYVKDAIKK